MALRVWLPLNGNLNNQGLSDLNFNISGTPVIQAGKLGNNYYLDGSSYFSTDETDVGNFSENFSMCIWFKSEEVSAWTRLCGRSAHKQYQFDINSAGKLRFWTSTDGTDADGHRTVLNSTDNIADNLWHHACGVCDGAKLYLYIDGILNASTNYLGGYSLPNAKIFIGMIDTAAKFKGMVADFRLYDECLSPKQVKEISKGLVAHYKLEGTGANPNLALNTLTTSPSGFYDYTGKASASRITDDDVFTSVYKIDFPEDTATYSNYNLYTTVPRDSSAATKDGKTYTLSFKIKASKPLSNYKLFYEYNNKTIETDIDTNWKKIILTGVANNQYSALYLCHTQTNRLKINGGSLYIAEVKLELGDTATDWIPNITDAAYTALGYDNMIARDVSGNGYNGTVSGTLSYNIDSPRYSGSTLFNGSSRIISETGSMAWCNFDNLTISTWLNPTTSPSSWSGSVGIQQDGGYTAGKIFSISNYAGKFSVQTDSSVNWVTTQSESLPLNTWSHCVAVLEDGTNLKMYLNGNLIKTTTLDWGTLTATAADTRLAIGVDLPGGDEYFTGSISDVRIYATALTADDILTLYKTSGIIDNEGNVYAYEFKEE